MVKQCINCRYCIKSKLQGAVAYYCGRVSFKDKVRFHLLKKKVDLRTRRVKGNLTCSNWKAKVC